MVGRLLQQSRHTFVTNKFHRLCSSQVSIGGVSKTIKPSAKPQLVPSKYLPSKDEKLSPEILRVRNGKVTKYVGY